jgi:hypothetical protein
VTARALKVEEFQLNSTAFARYRLAVIAADVADVVTSAGGWLFDRAMSGWDVDLFIADAHDVRPLQILGIKAHPLALADDQPHTHALAVSADMVNAETCVREMVIAALDRNITEVALWGETWPSELHHRAQHMRHRLSCAARAFKEQAAHVAELPAMSVSGAEIFRGGVPWGLPYESDLLPIG